MSFARYQKLIRPALILMITISSAFLLMEGKPVLVPIAFAGLLAMLFLPVSKWLERKGWNKALAALSSVFILVIAIAGVGVFIGVQVSRLAEDSSKIEKEISTKYKEAQQYVAQTLGIPKEKQEKMLKEQQSSSGGKMTGMITGIISGIGGIMTDSLLVMVYIFLLIYFRDRIRRFILRIVPDTEERKTKDVLFKIQKVSQKYLTGLALMIASLWVMYGIGFSIAGLENAIFFAILCGMLETIPFIGNLVGNALAIIMSLIQGGDTNVVLGIVITYVVVQFLQSYILEPLVVGREVNINPLFTIIGLVVGEFLWGIPGMVLAIPLLGIAKIICDHVESLKPYGELIGESKKKESHPFRKLIQRFKN